MSQILLNVTPLRSLDREKRNIHITFVLPHPVVLDAKVRELFRHQRLVFLAATVHRRAPMLRVLD